MCGSEAPGYVEMPTFIRQTPVPSADRNKDTKYPQLHSNSFRDTTAERGRSVQVAVFGASRANLPPQDFHVFLAGSMTFFFAFK